MSDRRILTLCPSCEHQALTLTEQGHLVCMWHACPQPVVETAIARMKRESASLRDGAQRSLHQLTDIQQALDAALAGGR